MKLFYWTTWIQQDAENNVIPSHDPCFNLPWCFLSLSLDDVSGIAWAPASPSLLDDENLPVPNVDTF